MECKGFKFKECNCKHCGAPVEQTSNRQRVYCNDACRMARKRAALKANTQSEQIQSEQPTRTGQPTMHERQCAANNESRPKADQHTVNTGPPKSFNELDKGEHNRVPLPGDEDYAGAVSAEMIEA